MVRVGPALFAPVSLNRFLTPQPSDATGLVPVRESRSWRDVILGAKHGATLYATIGRVHLNLHVDAQIQHKHAGYEDLSHYHV